jgi:hypothetical protein
MHAITEADITEPRRLIREHSERTGESLSPTSYVVARLAQAMKIMKTKERDHGKVRPGSPARRPPARSVRAVWMSARRNRRPPEDNQPSVEVPELERREA